MEGDLMKEIEGKFLEEKEANKESLVFRKLRE